MTITVSNTTKVIQFNGVPARIWEGTTSNGQKVHCYITRIACDEDADQTQFQNELQEMQPPSKEVEAIPLRMII